MLPRLPVLLQQPTILLSDHVRQKDRNHGDRQVLDTGNRLTNRIKR